MFETGFWSWNVLDYCIFFFSHPFLLQWNLEFGASFLFYRALKGVNRFAVCIFGRMLLGDRIVFLWVDSFNQNHSHCDQTCSPLNWLNTTVYFVVSIITTDTVICSQVGKLEKTCSLESGHKNHCHWSRFGRTGIQIWNYRIYTYVLVPLFPSFLPALVELVYRPRYCSKLGNPNYLYLLCEKKYVCKICTNLLLQV